MTGAFSLKGVLRRAEKKPCFSLANTSVFRGVEGWGEIRGSESELGAQGHVVDASSQILAPRPPPRVSARAPSSLRPRRAPRPAPRASPALRSARPGAARSPRPGPRVRKVGTTWGPVGTHSSPWRWLRAAGVKREKRALGRALPAGL